MHQLTMEAMHSMDSMDGKLPSIAEEGHKVIESVVTYCQPIMTYQLLIQNEELSMT